MGHAAGVALVLYPLKNALLTPVTALRKRKYRVLDLDPGMERAFEYNHYSPAFASFVGHSALDPLALVRFGLDETSVALDVGAFDGSWSRSLWDLGQPTIYAFEPAPGALGRAHEKLDELDRVHLFPYGLGAADETVSMGLSGLGSSLYVEGTMGSAEVEVRDVVGVLDELELDHVDLMKLNIEGAEYDLLDRLIDAGRLSSIDRVLVQFHEWHPHAYRRRRRIRRALATTHDETWCHPWVWECWTRRT